MTSELETVRPTTQAFSMRGTPLLSAGRIMSELAIAEQLRLHVKVYAEGGENSLHSHHFEDHAFFILAGEATFTGEDGSTTVVGPCDGMMIPRNAAYLALRDQLG